jgi:hypothetical protein
MGEAQDHQNAQVEVVENISTHRNPEVELRVHSKTWIALVVSNIFCPDIPSIDCFARLSILSALRKL